MKIVAELGINHNGDLEIAKKLIDVCSIAGIKYVKLQKRDIDLVYSQEQLNSDRISPWGITFRDQKKGLELSESEYDEINKYCAKKGISWFVSVWDTNSVEFIQKYNCPFIKIPSALITNNELLEKVNKTKIPVIISVGMSTYSEIKNAIEILDDNLKYILVCNSSYPCPDGKNKIYLIRKFKELFSPNFKIGFSSHSKNILSVVSSLILGSEMTEFHITLDKQMYGSDQQSSLDPCDVFNLMKQVLLIKKEKGNNQIWKVYPEEEIIKKKLRG